MITRTFWTTFSEFFSNNSNIYEDIFKNGRYYSRSIPSEMSWKKLCPYCDKLCQQRIHEHFVLRFCHRRQVLDVCESYPPWWGHWSCDVIHLVGNSCGLLQGIPLHGHCRSPFVPDNKMQYSQYYEKKTLVNIRFLKNITLLELLFTFSQCLWYHLPKQAYAATPVVSTWFGKEWF